MTGEAPFEDEYFKALALPTGDVSSESFAAKRAALDRAHSLRQFEIENYWKRGTYFWAFQLAAFALLGLIWRAYAQDQLTQNVLLLPAGLGAITALVGLLTAKGSKFWQENWESHVDLLEAALEGRLTQTVIVRSGIQWSVTRVNERLFWLLLIGWCVLFVGVATKGSGLISESLQPWLGLIALFVSFWVIIWDSKSKLKGMSYFSDAKNWQPTDAEKNSGCLGTARAIVKVAWKKFRAFVPWIANDSPSASQIILRDTVAGKAKTPVQPNVQKGEPKT